MLQSNDEMNGCFDCVNIWLKGCSYGGELTRLSGLARLGKMIFFPRSQSSQFNQNVCYVAGKRLFNLVVFTIKWRKAIMQNKCSYII